MNANEGTGREVVAEFGAKAQLAGLDRGAGEGEGPHGFKGAGRDAAVRVHDDEAAGRHKGSHDVNELEKLVLEFPLLALGTQAPGGGVEDDAVVGVASLGLATGELEGVLDHPPDAVQAAAFHVLTCPVDDLTDGVAVDHVRPDLPCGEAGAARVRKQVEEPLTFAEVGRDEFPVVRLLGEEADVLELGHLQLKGQIQSFASVPNRPPLGGAGRGAPFAVRASRRLERGVGGVPQRRVSGRLPQSERVGPHRRHLPKPLQPFSVAGVKQRILAPMGGDKSHRHGAASSATSRIFGPWAGKEVADRAATSLWGATPTGAARASEANTARRTMARPPTSERPSCACSVSVRARP